MFASKNLLISSWIRTLTSTRQSSYNNASGVAPKYGLDLERHKPTGLVLQLYLDSNDFSAFDSKFLPCAKALFCIALLTDIRFWHSFVIFLREVSLQISPNLEAVRRQDLWWNHNFEDACCRVSFSICFSYLVCFIYPVLCHWNSSIIMVNSCNLYIGLSEKISESNIFWRHGTVVD